MVFLKRNIFWIISGLFSAGMLAATWLFTASAMGKSKEAFAALEKYTDVVNKIETAEFYPTQETIDKINRDTAAVKSFTTNAESLFAYEKPSPMNAKAFKLHLINSLVKLRQASSIYNVKLPENFNFTFRHLLQEHSLVPYSIEPLSIQLRDIEEIVQILYESRIHAIEKFKREPAYAMERGGRDGVLMYDRATRTNLTTAKAIFTSTPYSITFLGFTSELTEVLNRFALADRFYVVKKLEVIGTRGSDLVVRRQRAALLYNLDRRVITPTVPLTALEKARAELIRIAQIKASMAGQTTPLEAIVDERPLRYNLLVDVVKLIPRPYTPPTGDDDMEDEDDEDDDGQEMDI